MVITEEEDRNLEVMHVNRALKNYGCPEWVLVIGAAPSNHKDSKDSERRKEGTTMKYEITLQYIKGCSEELHRTFMVHGLILTSTCAFYMYIDCLGLSA